jgi:murein DD-endopeptidase MepM/ murein hydrolase activator NlpD
MANFDFNLDDIINPDRINSSVIGNTMNYSPSGQAMGLHTSQSMEGERRSLTSWNISDILQGSVTYKPAGINYTQFNEETSKTASTIYNAQVNGKRVDLSDANKYLAAFDTGKSVGSLLDITGLGGASSGGGTSGTPGGVPNSGTVERGVVTDTRVAPGGIAFPLKMTKTQVREGFEGARWNHESQGNVHHTYNAADIFAPTGTVVVSVTSGTVLDCSDTAQRNSPVGTSVRVKGDNNMWYYYCHMGANTLAVSKGDVIQAGTILGKVGTSVDAQNTIPHLHFDVSPQDNSFSRGYNGAEGPLLNPQPSLIEAYNLLPE